MTRVPGSRKTVLGMAVGLGMAVTSVMGGQVSGDTRLRLGGESLDDILQRTVGAEREALWVGWEVPAIGGELDACCWRGWGERRGVKGCSLEDRHGGMSFSLHHGEVRGGEQGLVVLLRIEGGVIDRVRAYSSDCPLDAGDLSLLRMDDVAPEESVELLARIAHGRIETARFERREEAAAALALHGHPRATTELRRLSAPEQPRDLRKEALFWLAQRGGDEIASFLLDIARTDRDPEVREHAVFALGQFPDDEGTRHLLDIAASPTYPREVRKQAIFWLAQSDDPRAMDLLAKMLN